eukprot:766801-Hanusia_phi.AAC.6
MRSDDDGRTGLRDDGHGRRCIPPPPPPGDGDRRRRPRRVTVLRYAFYPQLEASVNFPGPGHSDEPEHWDDVEPLLSAFPGMHGTVCPRPQPARTVQCPITVTAEPLK